MFHFNASKLKVSFLSPTFIFHLLGGYMYHHDTKFRSVLINSLQWLSITNYCLQHHVDHSGCLLCLRDTILISTWCLPWPAFRAVTEMGHMRTHPAQGKQNLNYSLYFLNQIHTETEIIYTTSKINISYGVIQ